MPCIRMRPRRGKLRSSFARRFACRHAGGPDRGGVSGCPGGSPTDTVPNWIVYRWPDEHGEALDWQWKERVIPYWKEDGEVRTRARRQAIAFEMHPNFVVYNPRTLLQLREAVGEEIGANCDLSHLFWQGCNAVEVIRFLAETGRDLSCAHERHRPFSSRTWSGLAF